MHLGGDLGGLDGGIGLSGVEVDGGGAQLDHHGLGGGKVFHLDGSQESISLLGKGEDLLFSGHGDQLHGREVLADHEGLGEALGGTLELPVIHHDIKGTEASSHFLDRLAGCGINGGKRGGPSRGLGKKVHGLLSQFYLRGADAEDGAVKIDRYLDMLESALEEELGDEHLKIEAGLLSGVLLIEVVLLEQCLDLDKSRGDGLDLGTFQGLARRGIPCPVHTSHGIQSRALGHLLEIPLETAALLLHGLSRRIHVQGILLGSPGCVDLTGNHGAEVGVDRESGGNGELTEGLVDILGVHHAW